jgi:hypothetical protein
VRSSRQLVSQAKQAKETASQGETKEPSHRVSDVLPTTCFVAKRKDTYALRRAGALQRRSSTGMQHGACIAHVGPPCEACLRGGGG